MLIFLSFFDSYASNIDMAESAIKDKLCALSIFVL